MMKRILMAGIVLGGSADRQCGKPFDNTSFTGLVKDALDARWIRMHWYWMKGRG